MSLPHVHGTLGLSRGLACSLTAWAAMAWPAGAQAQATHIEPSFDARLIQTDNVGFNRPELAQRDTIFNLYSQARVDLRGPSYRFGGTIGLLAVENFNTSTPKHLLPRVQVELNSEVVDRTFFIDADAGIVSTREDPFGARTDPSIVYDALGSLEYRFGLRPRIQRDLTPDLKFLLRSDNTWVRTDSADAATATQPDVHYQDSALRLERRAVPLGFSLDLRRQKEVNETVNQVETQLDSIRASATYAIDVGLVGGMTYGRERSAYASSKDVDPIRGVSLEWQPGERTDIRGNLERRFFGSGWDFALRHRTPFMTMSLSAARQPILSSTVLGVLPAGSDAAAMLDAILTTRYPNSTDRASVVRSLLASQGLTGTTNQAIEIRSQSAQLVQTTNAAVGWLGTRTSVFLTAFASKSEPLNRAGAQTISLNNLSVNQKGLSLQASRRLTPDATLNLIVTQTRANGQREDGSGESSRDRSGLVSWIYTMTPRSTVQAGVSKHVLRTDSQIVPSASELRTYAGFAHRF